jgi:ubiquinone/menaquinone biosynthesis C-methylase UbiE
MMNAGISGNSVVLDAACGRGEILVQSIKQGAEKAVGIDLSNDALCICRQYIKFLPKFEQGKIILKQCLVQKLPFEKAEFSHVFFLDIIEHLTGEDAYSALTEIKRVMLPGAKLILHTDNRLYIYYSRYILYFINKILHKRAVLDDQNFETTGHIKFYSYHELKNILMSVGFRKIKVNLTPINSIKQTEYYFSTKNKKLQRIFYIISIILSKTPIYYLFSPTLWAIAEV